MIAKQHVKNEVAHPTGFEPVTSAFGARCLSAKYLNLLERMFTNQHERIRNTTVLSGNNPEVVWGEIKAGRSRGRISQSCSALC
jgi:hypothetical protein